MRILQALAGAQYGGAERFFERLIPALADIGITQRVLFRTDERRHRLLSDAGLTDLHMLRFGSRIDLGTRRAFKRHVADFAPDLVFTWMSRATMMAPASPVAGQKFCSVARLGGYYDLKYYRHCDYLIGDTEAIVAYLIEQGWPEDRAVYLPNFVDDRKAEALPRSVLAVPEGTRLLLGLGRLHRNKGFDVLLEALSLLPDCVLLLAGTGPEEEALKAHAAALGIAERVRFLGWREDVAALMASVDLFVHPARHEPLGNVILEAWAHQRVVIACESDGPRRLIEDGVTGLLAPIDEPGRLAEIINEALSEPGDCASMAAAGAQFYAEHFAKPAVVRQYADFFARILG